MNASASGKMAVKLSAFSTHECCCKVGPGMVLNGAAAGGAADQACGSMADKKGCSMARLLPKTIASWHRFGQRLPWRRQNESLEQACVINVNLNSCELQRIRSRLFSASVEC
jgi:hypothetical protein